jgi:elongation factor Ts
VAEFEVSAATVAELRRETGAGMMDCKKALQEAKGDKEAALAWLRKRGIAAAEKRAERSANEGVVAFARSEDGQTGALVEINSETDFVAKSDAFRSFADTLAKTVLNWKAAEGKSVDDLKTLSFTGSATVGDVLSELIGKIGEKLEIRRFARVQVPGGFVGHYIHADNKLGVMVLLDGISATNPEAAQLGRDLAMQVAAASPAVVRREEVPKEKVESERAIEIERARTEGKPEAAVPKIAEGRINKWFADVALLEQPFIKDPKIIVKQIVEDASKRAGVSAIVKSFIRFRVGA